MATPGRKPRNKMLPGVKQTPLALERLRAERDLKTVAALANFLGWDPQICLRIENGGRDLSLAESIYIANSLGIGLEELLEDPNVIQKIPARNTISDKLQDLVRKLPSHHAAALYLIMSDLVGEEDELP